MPAYIIQQSITYRLMIFTFRYLNTLFTYSSFSSGWKGINKFSAKISLFPNFSACNGYRAALKFFDDVCFLTGNSLLQNSPDIFNWP